MPGARVVILYAITMVRKVRLRSGLEATIGSYYYPFYLSNFDGVFLILISKLLFKLKSQNLYLPAVRFLVGTLQQNNEIK